MSKYRLELNPDQNEYDKFVSNHKLNALAQSYNWYKIKPGWDHLHTAVYDQNNNMVGAGLILIKNLPGKFTMMYLPHGPVMDYEDSELVSFYMDQLKKLGKEHKAVFIKFDPNVHINDYYSNEKNDKRYDYVEPIMENLKQAGALHQGFTIMIEESIQPRFQAVVYKDQEGKSIEERLPKHTKRLIKDAKKRKVEIVSGHEELLDDFSKMIELTEKRKGVSLRNKDYFKLLLDTYGDDAVLFMAYADVDRLLNEALAEKESLEAQKAALPENAPKKRRRLDEQIASVNKRITEFETMKEQGLPAGKTPIAGILSVKYGTTCEMLYAGMDERFKSFMPQYLAYPENFKWAFENGCDIASMGGVEGTLEDGLTKFKDNFAPIINELIGEFDLPVGGLLYRPAKLAYEKVKGKMLNA